MRSKQPALNIQIRTKCEKRSRVSASKSPYAGGMEGLVQNLGHENEMTTFRGYGEVPFQRQSEIIKAIGRTAEKSALQEQIAKLEQIASALRETAC